MDSRDKIHFTAFIRLEEQLKSLSNRTINCKVLYGLVGREGHYFDHNNPIIRKQGAGELSRIAHSGRYIDDMQDRFRQNNLAFKNAAEKLVDMLEASSSSSLAYPISVLTDSFPPLFMESLEEEKQRFRGEVDLLRVTIEMQCLSAYAKRQLEDGESEDSILAMVLESYLWLLAFGRLDKQFSRTLQESLPRDALPACPSPEKEATCLVRIDEREEPTFKGASVIDNEKPFTVGRYTTCDVLEMEPAVSLLHAVIYRKSGNWWFEDLDSEEGSKVFRASKDRRTKVYDSREDGPHVPFELEFGDYIELADGAAQYRFARLGTILG